MPIVERCRLHLEKDRPAYPDISGTKVLGKLGGAGSPLRTRLRFS